MSGEPSTQRVPPFTTEHDALREEIRSFVAEELRTHAGEWEQARGHGSLRGAGEVAGGKRYRIGQW